MAVMPIVSVVNKVPGTYGLLIIMEFCSRFVLDTVFCDVTLRICAYQRTI
jgi:hypothetical protein